MLHCQHDDGDLRIQSADLPEELQLRQIWKVTIKADEMGFAPGNDRHHFCIMDGDVIEFANRDGQL